MAGRQLWTDDEITTMLNIFIEKRIVRLMDRRKYREMEILELVATEMREAGFVRSVGQIHTKWKNLRADFTKASKHNSTSGMDRREVPYESQLVELLGRRPVLTTLSCGVQTLNVPGEPACVQLHMDGTTTDDEDTPDPLEIGEGCLEAFLPINSVVSVPAEARVLATGSPSSTNSTASLNSRQPTISESSSSSGTSLTSSTPSFSNKRKNNGDKGSYSKALKQHTEQLTAVYRDTTKDFRSFLTKSSEEEFRKLQEFEEKSVTKTSKAIKEGIAELGKVVGQTLAQLLPALNQPPSMPMYMPFMGAGPSTANTHFPTNFRRLSSAEPNSPHNKDQTSEDT